MILHPLGLKEILLLKTHHSCYKRPQNIQINGIFSSYFGQSIYSGQAADCSRIAPLGHGLDGASGQRRGRSTQRWSMNTQRRSTNTTRHGRDWTPWASYSCSASACLCVFVYFCPASPCSCPEVRLIHTLGELF